MKKKYSRLLVAFVLSIGIFFLYTVLSRNLQYETKFDQRFTSPDNETEIFVRYDYVSRPSIFLKDGTEIFSYDGPGFMETIKFEVDWLDNNTFILYNRQMDESYTVEIPE